MQSNSAVCGELNGMEHLPYTSDENTYRRKIGNNIIILKEHFENKATTEHLIENVIRYDWNIGEKS